MLPTWRRGDEPLLLGKVRNAPSTDYLSLRFVSPTLRLLLLLSARFDEKTQAPKLAWERDTGDWDDDSS